MGDFDFVKVGARPHRRHALDAGGHQAGQAAGLRPRRSAGGRPGVRPARQPGLVDGELRAVRPARPAPDAGPRRRPAAPAAGARRWPTSRCAAGPTARSTSSGSSAACDAGDGRCRGRGVAGGQGSHQLRGHGPRPTPWPCCPTAPAWPAGDPVEVVLLSLDRRAVGDRPCRRRLRSAGPPMAEPLVDSFGRVHRDLRISVTDRCNFRCTYCMPAEGMEWLPRDELLTFEEIERVARLCVERFGFDGIRLTGGEPTVRAHLPVLVEKLAARSGPRRPRPDHQRRHPAAAGRTTCAAAGLRPHQHLARLAARPTASSAITRRDALAEVLDGIDAALAAGLHPVKVNVVLMRGVNDDEVGRLRRLRPRRGVDRPLHRVHAPRRRRRLDAGRGRARRRDPGRHRRRLPARAGRARGHAARRALRATATAGARSASSPASPAPFCGDVRPGAPHRRRPVPQLPVRHSTRPTCGRCCAAGRPTTSWRPPCGGTWPASGPGTRSARSHFIRPRRSMSQIGG